MTDTPDPFQPSLSAALLRRIHGSDANAHAWKQLQTASAEQKTEAAEFWRAVIKELEA